MRILILGSSGRLVNILYKSLKKKHQLFHNGLNKRKYDISNFNKIKKLFLNKLDLIVNCSGETNIEICEKKKQLIQNKKNH